MMSVVTGLDVGVVGWIPRFPPNINLLPASYQNWVAAGVLFSRLRRSAIEELFASGNTDPPQPIGGFAGWQALASGKEFRVAVALRNVRADWATRGIGLTYDLDVFPGYTPINRWLPPAASGQAWQHQTWLYVPGTITKSVRRQRTAQEVRIRVTVRAKLIWFLNFAQAALTFHMAPWAIVRFEYRLDRKSGNTSIEFFGSTIPSQMIYVNWTAHAQFNMNRNTVNEIDGFIRGGNCRNAPMYRVSYFP